MAFEQRKRLYKTKENENVYSLGEKEIADFLHDQNIYYLYETKRVLDNRTLIPDFYIPKYDVYIEYQGMKGDPQSDNRYRVKYAICKDKGINVIYLYRSQIGRFGDYIMQQLNLLKPLY